MGRELLFIYLLFVIERLLMIRYESSRDHMIDEIKPNQTGNTAREKSRES